MIDQEKVGLMTRLAIYEKKEKNSGLLYSRYFETDYVRYNILKTWVASTVAYWLIIAAYSFLHFDELLGKVNEIDYFAVMYKLLGGYVLFVFAYFVLGTFVYHVRYEKKKHGLVEYNGNMRKLIELNEGTRAKVKNDTQLENVTEAPAAKPMRQSADPSRGTVSRMNMVNARLAEEQEAKRQEIIANVNRLNERREREQAANEQRKREIEMEKERIRQRRRALEEEQMARLRKEREQSFVREDHTYSGPDQKNGQAGGNK